MDDHSVNHLENILMNGCSLKISPCTQIDFKLWFGEFATVLVLPYAAKDISRATKLKQPPGGFNREWMEGC